MEKYLLRPRLENGVIHMLAQVVKYEVFNQSFMCVLSTCVSGEHKTLMGYHKLNILL